MEINKFLELTGEFSNSLIDQNQDDEVGCGGEYSENEIVGHKIIDFKGNFIPKGLVPLAMIFSKDDTPLRLAMQSS